MSQNNVNYFEKHPKTTASILFILILLAIYGLCSIKIHDNSIKLVLHRTIASKIIDNNVGRFIKLREHPPTQVRYERPTKNYMKNVASGGIERKYYRIATDEQGFIGPNLHDNPDMKIVFLGGSTTECLYVDEEKRFPYLVGRLLEQSLAKKVNTYNGGVSANDSLHSLNILMNKVLPMKPTTVVLMHNINDLVVLRSQGTYWYTDSLKSHVQTAKNVFASEELPVKKVTLDEAGMVEAFKQNLETFIAICRIHHISPVLMTQANRVKNDPLYHRFNQAIKDVAHQQQVKVIDLATAIPSTEKYLYDSYHYTAKGSELAAAVVAQEWGQAPGSGTINLRGQAPSANHSAVASMGSGVRHHKPENVMVGPFHRKAYGA